MNGDRDGESSMVVGKNKKIKEKKLNKNNIIIANSVTKISSESPVIILAHQMMSWQSA